jgi:hypothetical protein
MTPRDNCALGKVVKSIYEIPPGRYRWQQKVLNVFSGFPFFQRAFDDTEVDDSRGRAPKWTRPETPSRSPPGASVRRTPDQPPGIRAGNIMIELEFFAQIR